MPTIATSLTKQEQLFFSRVALKLAEGLDIAAAGRAVLGDDIRIANTIYREHGHFGTQAERHDDIASNLSAETYRRLRAESRS